MMIAKIFGAGFVLTALASCTALSVDDLNGEWTLHSIEWDGQQAANLSEGKLQVDYVTNETPYLGFQDGRMWGYSGCNHLNGSVTVDQKTVDFSKVASTMRLCPDSRYEQLFMASLRSTAKIKATKNRLVMKDKSGNTLMTLERRVLSPGLLAGEWNVVQMLSEDGSLVDVTPSDRTPYLGFDIEASRVSGDVFKQDVHGFTGCNRIMGTVDVSGLEDGKLTFPNLATTRMACPDDSYEAPFLRLLDKATHVSIYQNELQLTDNAGNLLLKLRRR